MIEPKLCADCGLPLPVTGRGQARSVCGECSRSRRRVKSKPASVCVDCGHEFVQANHTGPTPQRCDECRVKRKLATDAEKTQRWRAANPDRAKAATAASNAKRSQDPEHRQRKRDNELRRVYGLTRAELDAMLEAQNHLCAICGNGHVGVGTRLHVDHCHASGKVRALLCGKCNTLIGLADDSPERLELAAAYLRRHQ